MKYKVALVVLIIIIGFYLIFKLDPSNHKVSIPNITVATTTNTESAPIVKITKVSGKSISYTAYNQDSTDQAIVPSRSIAEMSVQEMFDLVNAFRLSKSLTGLSYNSELDSAAQKRADDMAATGNFSHTDASGNFIYKSAIKNSGYVASYEGENLAEGFQTSQDVVTAWINSPEHLANIVNKHYTDTGFGIAEGVYQGSQSVFIVQLFATK